MERKTLGLVGIAGLAAVAGIWFWGMRRPGWPAASPGGEPIVAVLAEDEIRAIDRPVFVPASRVDFLAPAEPVLGVEAGGEAKAYSLRNLDLSEVVNDRLGGRPIAVAW